MSEGVSVKHCRQYCLRCNGLIFEYYASPDGHFGLENLVEGVRAEGASGQNEVRCGTCGARYRLLERLNGRQEAVVRI